MQHRPWWTRNWKWAVPTGCLLVLLLAFGGCVSLFVGAFAAMKNTGAYTQAVERARSHPDAVARLGEPIEAGWLLQGRFDDHGATGEAAYSVPVHGPRGRGTLHVEARKHAGRWTFEWLELVPDDGAPIDLRTPDERAAGDAREDREAEGDDDPGRRGATTAT